MPLSACLILLKQSKRTAPHWTHRAVPQTSREPELRVASGHEQASLLQTRVENVASLVYLGEFYFSASESPTQPSGVHAQLNRGPALTLLTWRPRISHTYCQAPGWSVLRALGMTDAAWRPRWGVEGTAFQPGHGRIWAPEKGEAISHREHSGQGPVLGTSRLVQEPLA